MKLALIGNAFVEAFAGGVEVVLAAQARELRRRGHRVRLIVGSTDPAHRDGDLGRGDDGLELLRIALDPQEEGVERRPRVARLVEEGVRGFDLAHVHHTARLSDDLVPRLAPHLPVVLGLHDHHSSCPRSFRAAPVGECPPAAPDERCTACVAAWLGAAADGDLAARLRDRWRAARRGVQCAARVVIPSQHLRESLARELELDGAAWECVPHGLCRDLGRPEREAAPGAPLTVLSFGNRTDSKGTADLVRALAGLPAGSARLLLAGAEVRPGFDAELRALAGPLELELHGAYDGPGLEALAARADLAAFPSRAAESYGLVVEEALALGLSTWVSDRGALGEVLEECCAPNAPAGRVLPAGDVEAWRRAFATLVEDPRRLQDERARLPRVQRDASLAVDRLLELYSEVLRVRDPRLSA